MVLTVFSAATSAPTTEEVFVFVNFRSSRHRHDKDRGCCAQIMPRRSLCCHIYYESETFPSEEQFTTKESCYSMREQFLYKEQDAHDESLYQVARSTNLYSFR